MADQHIYSPETIIKAYSLGLFPMADSHDSLGIRFYDPDQRALIPIDNTLGRGVHIPRRLQRQVRQAPYAVTINQDFTAVIDACATLSDQREDTWINRDIRRLYIALHKMGFAHSIEVWLDGALVGGLYGVALRAAFFGESMFTRKSDASKIALVHLMARLRHGRFLLLDAQFTNGIPTGTTFGVNGMASDLSIINSIPGVDGSTTHIVIPEPLTSGFTTALMTIIGGT